jgi:hypothetical protein
MEKDEYLKKYGIEPKAILNNQQPASITTDSVAQMRERLEVKKLEIELSKLEKPDTSIDYYSKMLELQEKNFTQLLDMTKQQSVLQLEIEKLKLMGDGESDSMLPYIQMLAPLLPAILKNSPPLVKSNTKDKESKGESGLAAPPEIQNQGGQEMTAPETLKELEEYKLAIKRGEISLEEAYTDFLATPWSSSMTKEQFSIRFDELKQTI